MSITNVIINNVYNLTDNIEEKIVNTIKSGQILSDEV